MEFEVYLEQTHKNSKISVQIAYLFILTPISLQSHRNCDHPTFVSSESFREPHVFSIKPLVYWYPNQFFLYLPVLIILVLFVRVHSPLSTILHSLTFNDTIFVICLNHLPQIVTNAPFSQKIKLFIALKAFPSLFPFSKKN